MQLLKQQMLLLMQLPSVKLPLQIPQQQLLMPQQ